MSWWEDAILGTLIIAPFLLRWWERPRVRKTHPELIEGFVFFFSLAVIAYLIFWHGTTPFDDNPLVYVLLALLTWAALRTGSRGTTLALFIVASISMSAAIYNVGSYAHTPAGQALLLLRRH